MNDLRIEPRPFDRWRLIEVHGDLDVYTAPRLKEFIAGEITKGNRWVAIDLGGVGFLDSTGLSVLVASLKRAKEEGGDLVILRPNEQIQRILSITDLTKILKVHEDTEALSGR